VRESSFFLKRQEDLDSEQPGAALVATVLIPEDGYPNTTFESGSLQLVTNGAGTEKDCRESTLVGAYGNNSRTMTIQGIVFRWSGQEARRRDQDFGARLRWIFAGHLLRIFADGGRRRSA